MQIMLHKQLCILNASSGLEGGLVWIGGKKAGWSDPWKYHETDIVYSNWNDGAYDVSMLQGICLNTTLKGNSSQNLQILSERKISF